MIRLALWSPLMTAGLVFRLSGSTAVMITMVRYTRAMARPLWAVVGPIHRQVVPRMFSRAAGLPLSAARPSV